MYFDKDFRSSGLLNGLFSDGKIVVRANLLTCVKVEWIYEQDRCTAPW